MAVREPGKPFWDFIVKDSERREKRDAILKQIESATDEQVKQFQKDLEELQQVDIIDIP